MTADLRELIRDTINTHRIRCPRCSGWMIPCSGCSADAVMLVVAGLVELIATGFDERAELAKVADREHRDVDVVLAHQSAARFVRTHAAGPSSASVEPQTSPGGTPGPPDPRDAVVDRAVEWRHRYSTPDIHLNVACMALADAVDALPATSPTGDPTP